jgi:hypothetical protein
MSLVERGPVDLVMALALVHHLAISNNTPLEDLASFFNQLGGWLIIEFIPKSDSQVKRLLSSRVDIFPDYTKVDFENAFSKYYGIVEEAPNRRVRANAVPHAAQVNACLKCRRAPIFPPFLRSRP